MAINPARWLVDQSVLARLDQPAVRQVVLPRMQAGRIAVSFVTELEIGFTAQSVQHYQNVKRRVTDLLIPVLVSPRAEQRAREVQAELVARGQHRAVAIPDLIVAAVAAVERLTVLHYDGDFDLIADITGQPTEWVLPRGTAD